MTGPEHYREAERLMTLCNGKNRDAVNVILSQAGIHATLAAAAAALGLDDDDNWPVTQ